MTGYEPVHPVLFKFMISTVICLIHLTLKDLLRVSPCIFLFKNLSSDFRHFADLKLTQSGFLDI
jgi:hypothetical protein